MRSNESTKIIFSALIIFTLLTTPSCAQAKSPLVLVGQDKESITQYLKRVDANPDGFMFYTSIQRMDGLYKPAPDRGAGIQHAQYFVKKYPGKAVQLGLYMVGALDGIIDGKYDKNIQKLGEWISQVQAPVYLRIGYEFDSSQNAYAPASYIDAFRHIVDELWAQDVENIQFVWHSHGIVHENKPIERWYPGDEYVDWIGASFFALYNAGDVKKILEFARERGKPFMLAEATPIEFDTHEGEKAWNRWYKQVFSFVAKNDIEMFCYINANWRKLPMFRSLGWPDARIEQNQYIKDNWLKSLQSLKVD